MLFCLDDVEMSISEVDIKADGVLEEGETTGSHTLTKTTEVALQGVSAEGEPQIIQIEGGDGDDKGQGRNQRELMTRIY